MKYVKLYVHNLFGALPVGLFFFSILIYFNEISFLNESATLNEFLDFYNIHLLKTIIFVIITTVYVFVYYTDKLSYVQATTIHFTLIMFTIYFVYFFKSDTNMVTVVANLISSVIIYIIIQVAIYFRSRSSAKKMNKQIRSINIVEEK